MCQLDSRNTSELTLLQLLTALPHSLFQSRQPSFNVPEQQTLLRKLAHRHPWLVQEKIPRHFTKDWSHYWLIYKSISCPNDLCPLIGQYTKTESTAWKIDRINLTQSSWSWPIILELFCCGFWRYHQLWLVGLRIVDVLCGSKRNRHFLFE